MDRLFRRRGNERAEPDASAAPEPRLEPIRVLGRDIEVAGWVAPAGARITDLLNSGAGMDVLPDGADASDPDSWLNLVSGSVLIVVPPPHVSPPEKRLHRQTQRVGLRVGPYLVTGTAHLRPGFEQDLFLRSTSPFLPLTHATIATEGAPDAPVPYDVVIVNLAEVQELAEL